MEAIYECRRIVHEDFLEDMEEDKCSEREMLKQACKQLARVAMLLLDYAQCDMTGADGAQSPARMLFRASEEGYLGTIEALRVLGKVLRINSFPCDDWESPQGDSAKSGEGENAR